MLSIPLSIVVEDLEPTGSAVVDFLSTLSVYLYDFIGSGSLIIAL